MKAPNQVCASVLARGRLVGLRKKRKQPLLLLFIQTDAGVSDTKLPGGVMKRAGHCDFALVGEAECVANQIHQNLLQTHSIGKYGEWCGGFDLKPHNIATFLSLELKQNLQLVD